MPSPRPDHPDGGSAHVLELLGKPGCHLCDEAREVVARVAAEYGVPWSERDITRHADDEDEYGDRIPVLLLDGKEHTYWSVDETRLRRALTG
jgi:glutaredoxin